MTESTRNLLISGAFRYKNIFLRVGQNVGQPHDPHHDPHVEMCGKIYKAPKRRQCLLSGAFCCLDVSPDLCHEAAHCLSCLILFLPCSVGVGSKGESGIIVPQHERNRFCINAILKCQRGESVPNIMKADVRQSRFFQ